jgi:hypothetical protein
MSSDISTLMAPAEIPDEVRAAWIEKGWPEAVLERAFEMRVPRRDVARWLNRGKGAIKRIQRDLDRRERLIGGTLRVREATWADDDAFADLYANSPEDAGEWEVTVERSPYPFAQFRLQENVSILAAEDRGVLLAAIVLSARNTLVGGKPVTVQIESAWRTRTDARGQGLGRLLRTEPRRAMGWEALATYYYRRRGSGGKRGSTASIRCFKSRPFDGDTDGIRPAQQPDVPACVALINRTHRDLDLFRPYSEEWLCERLNDPCWGAKPDFWIPVYGWDDYYVLEEGGQIIACAGLWDRGKHMREVWRHKTAGKSRIVENTALMDFGYAEGHADAMARLIGYLVGVTNGLGRSQLMAPLQFLPAVVESLEAYEAVRETRPIYWQALGAARNLNARLTRPYTDLAYW